MSTYRAQLPQLSGGLFLTDGGVETDLIFNHGIEIREFAAHTLLSQPREREALARYFRRFLTLAERQSAGFILDSQTWKAHRHWAGSLGADERELHAANRDSIDFIAALRDEFRANTHPVVLNGIIGPQGDAYAPDAAVASRQAEEYHGRQIEWLADTAVDMITAMTFTQSAEAIGFVRAARSAGVPMVVSFTVETDGHLPNGQALRDAIGSVDDATAGEAAYFMVNCAHPDHFFDVFDDSDWCRRIRGLRCNASRQSHAELDECEVLDDGDANELAAQYGAISEAMPWLNVFGGCCGTDLRHISRIAEQVGKR
jgi:homocysteine S-methyltransferase